MAADTATATAVATQAPQQDKLAPFKAWIERREALIAQALAITTVADQTALNLVAGVMKDGKKMLSALESQRKELTAPLLAERDRLIAQERELGGPLLAEIKRLQPLADKYATQLAYDAEIARKKAEREQAEAQRMAEEAAEKERARLQAIADKETADKRAAAALVFGTQAAATMVPEADTVEVPVAAPPPSVAPPPPPKAVGGRMVVRWTFQVTDPNAVPREFCTPDDVKIRAWMNYHTKMENKVPAMAGVKFSSQTSVESGR